MSCWSSTVSNPPIPPFGEWPTGDNEPWPRQSSTGNPNDGSMGEDGDPVPNPVVGTFANFLECTDEVFRSSDGKPRTVLFMTMMRQDGEQVEVRLPTELVVGLMERMVQHFGFIFPYRTYDAPNVTDESILEEFGP